MMEIHIFYERMQQSIANLTAMTTANKLYLTQIHRTICLGKGFNEVIGRSLGKLSVEINAPLFLVLAI